MLLHEVLAVVVYILFCGTGSHVVLKLCAALVQQLQAFRLLFIFRLDLAAADGANGLAQLDFLLIASALQRLQQAEVQACGQSIGQRVVQ